MNRPSWDHHALFLAFAASYRSEDPYKKVGACALDNDNNVLGVAYNGLTPGKVVDQQFWQNRDARRPYIIHAEANLLARISVNQATTIAVTMMPCAACARSIAAHGIKRVIYSEVYDYDRTGIDILDFYNIDHIFIPKKTIINTLTQNISWNL